MILYFRDQDIRADALKEGIDIGRQEEALRIAQSMLEKGMDPELILEMTGLSPSDLDDLYNE